MKTVKIVIGANFGDEGKGLMTDYFANEAKRLRQSCLVVCHNGGSQKGHTVVSPSGLRHVFHHFGSGNLAAADTYLSSQYIVNPILFNRELSELQKKGAATKTYVDKNCRLTTPFDMMINQITEEYRGAEKHGSCGLGIFETITRTNRHGATLTFSEFARLPVTGMGILLEDIAANYLPCRLKQLGIDKIPMKWIEILSKKDRIIENYIVDFLNMAEHVEITDSHIMDAYDYVIFEGAQGLLLDQNNISYMPHLTPSNTGIQNPSNLLGKRESDVEACYVSRTYMTRHGAGRFDTECQKSDINPKIIDLTNIPNPYQDSLRYGTLNLYDLRDRIEQDLGGRKYKKSIAVTHCNEYGIDRSVLAALFCGFKVYLSDGMTYRDIVEHNSL